MLSRVRKKFVNQMGERKFKKIFLSVDILKSIGPKIYNKL